MSGDFEMIRINTGERIIIHEDGTELRDLVSPPSIEWCDKGQHYANRLNGNYTGEAYSQLWICLQCEQS
jgi:hypothetical protein